MTRASLRELCSTMLRARYVRRSIPRERSPTSVLPRGRQGVAWAINNAGEAVGIVGQPFFSAGQPLFPFGQPFFYDGTYHGLPTLAGGTGQALAINDAGDIVGD